MNRPCPPDFLAQHARLAGNLRALMTHYSAGGINVTRWARQHGVHKPAKGRTLRPMPAEFMALAAEHTDSWLRRHFEAGEIAVERWREESGIPAPTNTARPIGRGGREMPDDFAVVCPTMTITHLMPHYRACDATIRKWAREAGVHPKAHRFVRGLPVSPLPPVDDTLLGQAKQHLRKFYPSVHSADILPEKERRSLPGKGKGLIIVGGKGAFPPAEVIALAETRGFDPRGSARI